MKKYYLYTHFKYKDICVVYSITSNGWYKGIADFVVKLSEEEYMEDPELLTFYNDSRSKFYKFDECYKKIHNKDLMNYQKKIKLQ